jgi:hypothetical protein
MNTENVIPMPDTLERLAREVNAGLALADAGETNWIEGKVKAATALAKARVQLPADQAFGAWCDDNFPKLNKDERAALVAMGAHPDDMRAGLQETTSRSILVFYRQEFRFLNVSRPPQGRGKRGANTPQLDKARARIRPLIEKTEQVNTRSIAKDLGVSIGTAETAVAAEVAYQEGLKEGEAHALYQQGKFTKTAAHHVEALINKVNRNAKKAADEWLAKANDLVDRTIAERLKEEKKRLDDLCAAYTKRSNDAFEENQRWRNLINNHKAIFTAAEFMTILKCLHPDNSASAEIRADAFRLFNAKKLQLTKER